MAEVVLDASAVLALLLEEPGADQVRPIIPFAHLSALNLAEVVQRLVDRGAGEDDVRLALSDYAWEVHPLDEAAAMRTGFLRTPTRRFGLSLGDRACLALAEAAGLPVLTADRAWRELDLGVEVVLIR